MDDCTDEIPLERYSQITEKPTLTAEIRARFMYETQFRRLEPLESEIVIPILIIYPYF